MKLKSRRSLSFNAIVAGSLFLGASFQATAGQWAIAHYFDNITQFTSANQGTAWDAVTVNTQSNGYRGYITSLNSGTVGIKAPTYPVDSFDLLAGRGEPNTEILLSGFCFKFSDAQAFRRNLLKRCKYPIFFAAGTRSSRFVARLRRRLAGLLAEYLIDLGHKVVMLLLGNLQGFLCCG